MTDITENDLDEEDAGPKPRVTDTPIEIWLQYGDELLVDTPHSTLARDGEVSWCDSQVFPFDVKYVRSDEVDRLRARVAELEAAKYGSNPSMVLLDEVHANGVDVDAIPISRLIAALDVLHRRVQERDDDGAATPGDMRAALRAIFNKGE